MQEEINAYDFIEMASETEGDKKFLLDCFVPTRFAQKFRNVCGSLEIVARAEPMRDFNDRIVSDAGDFTESLVRNLSQITDPDGCFSNYRVPRSEPEWMARDGLMYSDPVRPEWLDRTAYKHRKLVTRSKIDPVQSRAARRIIYVRETIQGPGETKHHRPMAEEVGKAEERTERDVRARYEGWTPPDEGIFMDDANNTVNFDDIDLQREEHREQGGNQQPRAMTV